MTEELSPKSLEEELIESQRPIISKQEVQDAIDARASNTQVDPQLQSGEVTEDEMLIKILQDPRITLHEPTRLRPLPTIDRGRLATLTPREYSGDALVRVGKIYRYINMPVFVDSFDSHDERTAWIDEMTKQWGSAFHQVYSMRNKLRVQGVNSATVAMELLAEYVELNNFRDLHDTLHRISFGIRGRITQVPSLSDRLMYDQMTQDQRFEVVRLNENDSILALEVLFPDSPRIHVKLT